MKTSDITPGLVVGVTREANRSIPLRGTVRSRFPKLNGYSRSRAEMVHAWRESGDQLWFRRQQDALVRVELADGRTVIVNAAQVPGPFQEALDRYEARQEQARLEREARLQGVRDRHQARQAKTLGELLIRWEVGHGPADVNIREAIRFAVSELV